MWLHIHGDHGKGKLLKAYVHIYIFMLMLTQRMHSPKAHFLFALRHYQQENTMYYSQWMKMLRRWLITILVHSNIQI